jgi:hypothetical protein
VGQQREFYRIALERSGTIRRGDETAACEVLDLTEKGVQLKTDLPVTVGETLGFDFSLTGARTIHCSIQVTRVSAASVGACVTDISPADQEELSRFIDELIALNLGGF